MPGRSKDEVLFVCLFFLSFSFQIGFAKLCFLLLNLLPKGSFKNKYLVLLEIRTKRSQTIFFESTFLSKTQSSGARRHVVRTRCPESGLSPRRELSTRS